MSTDIKISELNEVGFNKTSNQLIVNDRSNSSDPGVTRKISITNLLPSYDPSDSSGNKRAIIGNSNLISSSQSAGNEAVNTNVIRDGAVTGVKVADNTISALKYADASITTVKLASQTITDIISYVHPVGCIYTTVNSTNPSIVFGFGTWAAFGAGRVPVGFNSAEAEFNAAEGTGGSKTHTLVTGEIPSHTHGFSATGTTSTTGAHTHTLPGGQKFSSWPRNGYVNVAEQNQGGNPEDYMTNFDATASNGDHAHSVSVNGTTSSAGTGGSHNNLQPYIVVYMWKRTA